jgi:hypothetical protein
VPLAVPNHGAVDLEKMGDQKRRRKMKPNFNQGCQIFLDTINPNGGKNTKRKDIITKRS